MQDSWQPYICKSVVEIVIRAKMIDKIQMCVSVFRVEEQVFYLGVQLLDYYLSKKRVDATSSPSSRMLLASSCFLIACKIHCESGTQPYPDEFEEYLHEKCMNKRAIIAKEKEVFDTILPMLSATTIYDEIFEKLKVYWERNPKDATQILARAEEFSATLLYAGLSFNCWNQKDAATLILFLATKNDLDLSSTGLTAIKKILPFLHDSGILRYLHTNTTFSTEKGERVQKQLKRLEEVVGKCCRHSIDTPMYSDQQPSFPQSTMASVN
jgi:hypothetical protein